MTEEDIKRMAKEAGFEGCAELTWEDVICTEELVAFAKLVAKQERERIAKEIEKMTVFGKDTISSFTVVIRSMK